MGSEVPAASSSAASDGAAAHSASTATTADPRATTSTAATPTTASTSPPPPPPEPRLAFVELHASRGTSVAITVRPDGTDRQVLASVGADIGRLAFSPDKSRIAFTVHGFATSVCPEQKQIQTADVSRGSRRPLVGPGCQIEERPAWSPQGDRIAYDSVVGFRRHVRIWTPTARTGGGSRATTPTRPQSSEQPGPPTVSESRSGRDRGGRGEDPQRYDHGLDNPLRPADAIILARMTKTDYPAARLTLVGEGSLPARPPRRKFSSRKSERHCRNGYRLLSSGSCSTTRSRSTGP